MSSHTLAFTPTQHTHPPPSLPLLPQPFTVLILGASRGIGSAIATSYATAGASTLILTARETSSLSSISSQCSRINPSIKIHLLPCDVASENSVEGLAGRIKEEVVGVGGWEGEKGGRGGGGLDVVVVNSGFSGPVVGRVTEGEVGDWKRCLDVNATGTYHAAHFLVPLLLSSSSSAGEGEGKSEGKDKRVGSFIVVSAAAAWITEGAIANTGYCISKLAQLRLVEMMARQFADEGLLCVGVHPGAVETEMSQSAPEEFRKYLTDSVDLCGWFCVWLTRDAGEKSWLSGRFVSATWYTEELTMRRDEILEKDLLKARIAMS